MALQSRRPFLERDMGWAGTLSLRDAQAITRHLGSLEPTEHDFRLGVVHSYTSDLLDPWLNFHAAVQGLNPIIYHAPYGMSLMESQTNSGLCRHEPDMTLFLFTREDLHPDFKRSIAAMDSEQLDTLKKETVQRLTGFLSSFRDNLPGRIVITILPSQLPAALGLYDTQAELSENAWWTSLKNEIATELNTGFEATMLLDMDLLLADIGRSALFDPRLWYMARFPFTPLAANEFSRRIVSLAVASQFQKAKVIVLDADNTLWGGIVGEDGINGIDLGPDYPGNTFVDFQRRILDYQQRGFILAICSKNNPDDVQEVLENHPHQVLRGQHFAAQRVNWKPKHENIISLAEELNLGLDSFIFVDDSHYECEIVRRHVPEVQVVQTPARPVDIPGCLEHVARLEILSLTEEDRQKTLMYIQEVKRKKHLNELDADKVTDIDDYLASLEMEMRIEIDSGTNIARLSQLTQKTNQFNLTTKRYNEDQIKQMVESIEWTVASFSMRDIFGDSGIVGLALMHHVDSSTTEVDTLLMSCRVIGRKAETAFFESLLDYLTENNIQLVSADYKPTLKNSLAADFYSNHGLELGDDGRFRLELVKRKQTGVTFPPMTVELST